MKAYIKPEIITADMDSLHMVAVTGPGDGDNTGNRYVGGTSLSKEDKGWDDWNE